MPHSFFDRLTDWNLYFRTCKVCGGVFLAKSQKYTMCSDKCHQKMKTQAKRDFDARATENEYDHIYKNEAQKRKTAVKNGQSSVTEFRDWVLQQLESI